MRAPLRTVALAVVLLLTACSPARELPRTPDEVGVPLTHGTDLARSCGISRVIDGDTVRLSCPDGTGGSARLMGFDTPETFRPRCAAEEALGRKATAYLRRRIAAATSIRAIGGGRDKYDRLLIRLFIDGEDLASDMVARGLAVRYSGGRRIDWCSRLG